MALIKTGTIVTRLSGKVGGQSFGNNKGGAYVKNIGAYTTNKSTASLASRAVFGTVTGYWRTLTPEQRTAWNTQAALLPYTNRVADVRYLSGFNYFVKVNVPLVSNGEDILPEPIPVVTFPEFSAEMWTFTATQMEIRYYCPEEDFDLVLYSAPWQAIGNVTEPTEWEQINSQPSNGMIFDNNFTSTYLAAFGQWPADVRVFFRVRLLSQLGGGYSPQEVIFSATYEEEFPVYTAIYQQMTTISLEGSGSVDVNGYTAKVYGFAPDTTPPAAPTVGGTLLRTYTNVTGSLEWDVTDQYDSAFGSRSIGEVINIRIQFETASGAEIDPVFYTFTGTISE